MIEDCPTAIFAKGPCMDKAGIVFRGAHEGRVNGISHEGAANELPTSKSPVGNRFAALIKGNCDIVQALLRSARSLATDSIAMHSDPTAIPNLDCIIKPSLLPLYQ